MLIFISLLRKTMQSDSKAQREPSLTEKQILPGKLNPYSVRNFDQNSNVLQFAESKNVFDHTQKVCIPLLLSQSEQKSEICVLYFHGNGESIDGYAYFLEGLLMEKEKPNFVAVEYPGYGLYSDQIISSQQILEDSVAAFDYVVSELKFDPSNVIVLGRSIGSGPASYLATKRKCKLVCLVSPFWSIKSWLLGLKFCKLTPEQVEDCFNNLNCIKDLQSPCLLVHGKKDTLIPISHCEKLEEELKLHQKDYKAIYEEEWTHNFIDFNNIFNFMMNYSNEVQQQ